MQVVEISDGRVVAQWLDVASLAAFAAKYGLAGPQYVLAGPEVRIGYAWAAGLFAPPPPAPPTSADVDAERDRRIEAGRSFTIGGKVIAVRGTARDRENMIALAGQALAWTIAGQGAATMQFRDETNTIHTLTWSEMQALAAEASAYVTACYAAAWAIKDAPGGIPADYTANSRWPGVA